MYFEFDRTMYSSYVLYAHVPMWGGRHHVDRLAVGTDGSGQRTFI